MHLVFADINRHIQGAILGMDRKGMIPSLF
jgi:hypothetical protein